MEEKRKSKRTPIKMDITIESLYKSGGSEIIELEEKVIFTDISNLGVGFICSKLLPMDHYFNAKITLDDEKMFYCVLRILRSRKLEQGYEIGCQFVGLAGILGEFIDEYSHDISHEKDEMVDGYGE